MNNPEERWKPMAISNPSTRLRNARSMPQWVQTRENARQNMQKRNENIAPPPPPSSDPPALDPDYEVIEFNGQQYSNALPAKPHVPGKRGDGRHCDLCGSSAPAVRCEKCTDQIFCMSCDDMYHRHPKRQCHVRKGLEAPRSTFRPPLPPKNEQMSAPTPPPRKNKRSTRMGSPSPFLGRSEQGPALPIKEFSIKDKMGSLKRMMGTRPLPPPPTQNNKFNTMREDFGRNASSPPRTSPLPTDRMGTLQQRYRQHQAAMRGTSSNIPLTVVELATKQSEAERSRSNSIHATSFTNLPDQLPPSRDSGYTEWDNDQWNGPPRHRSSSISSSSGIGSRRPYSTASNDVSGLATMSRHRGGDFQSVSPTGQRNNGFFGRGMMQSSSVCDLQNMQQQVQQPPPMFHPMQAAQSMAHLNCPSCHHAGMVWMPPTHPWDYTLQGRTPSMGSLNMPPQGYPADAGFMPPMWAGTWHPGMGMQQPVQYPGMNPPQPNMSRRPPSPARSIKSQPQQRYNHHMASPPHSVKSSQALRRPPSPAQSFKSRKSQASRASHAAATDTSEDERYSNDGRDSDDEQEVEEPVAVAKPVVPTHQWECEHCTYVNRAGTRVCAICCKTPTDVPKQVQRELLSERERRRRLRRSNTDPSETEEVSSRASKSSEVNEPRQRRHSEMKRREDYDDRPYEGIVLSKFNNQLRMSPLKSSKALDDYEAIQMQASDVESNASKKKGSKREEPMPQRRPSKADHSDSMSETKSIPSAISDRHTTTTTTTTSSDNHSQISLDAPYQPAPNPPIESIIPFKSVLKSNESVTSKVSTGVGPSPPREILERKPDKVLVQADTTSRNQNNGEAMSERNALKKDGITRTTTSTSTGTSPPPQSISTQTYDVAQKPSMCHPDYASPPTSRKNDPEPIHNGHEDRYHRSGRRLKRAMSLHINSQSTNEHDPWGTTPHYLYRSQSRQSLLSDAQSLPFSREGSPSRYDDDALMYDDRGLSYRRSPRREHESRGRSYGDPRRSLQMSDSMRSQGDLSQHQDHWENRRTSYQEPAGYNHQSRV